MVQRATKERSKNVIDRRLARAIAHPLRVEILIEVGRAPMSPSEFAQKFDGDLSKVSYHFRELEKCDCLEIVSEAPRRGAVEHYYRATKRALFDDDEFAQLPASVRGGFNASILSTFINQAVGALEADTMDSHENRHLTWSPVVLDEAGFNRIMEMLGDVYTALGDEELAAVERMAESGEAPIFTTVALAGFESPAPKRGAGSS